MTATTPFGPTGEAIYDRTYSRTKHNGEKEVWAETVDRVVRGNLALVYGDESDSMWPADVQNEYTQLRHLMLDFKVIPAGRHLWAAGVKGGQYLFNCHVSGWGEKLSDHFDFTFMRLMEGGGVGANYSSRFLEKFELPGLAGWPDNISSRQLAVHIVCDPDHQDYAAMKDAGLLSEEYDSDWEGSFTIEDSREGWAAGLVDLIDTFMQAAAPKHAARVYDVTNVRPQGARLKTFGGTASGPAPFATMMHEVGRVFNEAGEDARHLTPVEAMEIDHAIAECVVSGGVRRSARMSIVRWDDPFIHEFLACKEDGAKHWTTNISVEVDDEFFRHLGRNPETEIAWAGSTRWHDRAKDVYEAVVAGMLTNGEPGLWNSSLSNHGEVRQVIATNPCGEIALESWENCNLGHVNLDAFAPKVKGGPVDWAGLAKAHRLMTRFLIRATYGDVNDPKQAERLLLNRRIGVGHFGVQGFLAKRGITFTMAPQHEMLKADLRFLYEMVRQEARDYAFQLRIPEPVKVTTVAPTGTIAKLPGATEGIHPIYSRYFIRRVRYSAVDEAQWATVMDYAAKGYKVEVDQYDKSGNTWIVEFPTKELLVEQVEAMGYEPELYVQSADEISVDAMLAFQAMYQECWADNAVSFTVNVPAEQHQVDALADGKPVPAPSAERVESVSEALLKHLPNLKGTTMMLDGSRPQAPYERITREQYEAFGVGTVEDSTDADCASGACPVR